MRGKEGRTWEEVKEIEYGKRVKKVEYGKR